MSRKSFIVKAAVIAAVVIALPFAASEKLKEVHYTLTTDKPLSAPVRLAFLSDVHNSRYGKDMSGLVDAVDRFRPDAVIFGGDLFDLVWEEENSRTLVSRLTERYRCYYSLGNHEFKVNSAVIKRGIKETGVILLEGGYSDLEAPGGTVRIIGIDGAGYTDELEAAEKAVSPELANILINHFPEEFPRLAGKGFDFILSGHAHGGQWRIPGLINGVFAPDQGIFPKYAGGLYTENGSTMILSRGLCRTERDLIIPRIFNRPEIVFITIEN